MGIRHRCLRSGVAAGLVATLLLAGCAGASEGDPAGDGGSQTPAPLAGMLPAKVREQGKIVAGGLMDVPPIAFLGAGGEPTGVNPDLARAVEKQLGIEIVFRESSFAGLRPSLQSGEIDIIWDSMNDTFEREKVLDFVDYLKAGYTLLVPGDNPADVQSLADLCGKSVATIRGAVQIKAVRAQSEECAGNGQAPIELKLYETAASARLQVKSERVAAFIGNAPVLLYLAQTAGGGSTFDAVVLDRAETSYYGIAFAKDDTQLRKAFAAALKAVMKKGIYQQILAEYGLSQLAIDEVKVNAAGT